MEYHSWFGILAMIRHQLSSRWAVTGRYEYYADPQSVMVSTDGIDPYRTSGVSVNLDHKFMDAILARLEGRYFFSTNEIYPKDGELVIDNFFLLATLSTKLNWSSDK